MSSLGLDSWIRSFLIEDPIHLSTFPTDMSSLNIRSALSTTFHPQTDGESEWVNQEIGMYLWLLLANDSTSWVHKLPMFEWYHNTNHHSATKQQPADLLFRFSLKLFPAVVPSLVQPCCWITPSMAGWGLDQSYSCLTTSLPTSSQPLIQLLPRVHGRGLSLVRLTPHLFSYSN